MENRQLARLLGALSFEERLRIIGSLIASGDEGLSQRELADLQLLEELFSFMCENYGAGVRLVNRAANKKARVTE